MSKEEKRVKKKVRRIIGKPLAQIRAAMKRTNKRVEEQNDWRSAWMEEQDLCADQVNWMLHIIYDADPDTIGKKDRTVTGRVDPAIVKEDGEHSKAVRKLDVQAGDIIEKWALRMACSPKAIDLATGVIKDEDDEHIYEGVDPSKLPNPMEDIDAPDQPDEPEDEGAPLT